MERSLLSSSNIREKPIFYLKGNKWLGVFILNLSATVIYFLLSFLAKAGFTWQSSAITLWPAAGFANAIAIAHGGAVLPGVALGNLLGTACDPKTGFAIQPFMIPVAIAAAGQSWLVKSTLFRLNLLEDNLTRTSRLLIFLLWIGPLGNWLAAVTFLLYNLCCQPGMALDQIYTGSIFWWVGDSIGSLIVLPLLLLVLPARRPIWAGRKSHLLNPLAGLMMLLITATLLERLLLEKINLTPELVEPLQDLHLFSTLTRILLALVMLGLILQVSGKSLEQEKKMAQSRLAADAAGAVIHEIGQPLMRLRVRLEKILKSLNGEVQKYDQNSDIEAEKEAVLSLEELDAVVLNTRSIQDLTLAGIRDTKTADLYQAINRAVAQLRPDLNRLDQDLTINIQDKIPNIISGQAQLQAAIRNLLVNASNAAGENGVIRLNVELLSDNIILEIEDSGPGFDKKSLPNGKERLKSTTGGMGLGLMIVRRVIDNNGGKITFSQSKSLGGAKVILLLSMQPSKDKFKK